jgi:hypothetical protein
MQSLHLLAMMFCLDEGKQTEAILVINDLKVR